MCDRLARLPACPACRGDSVTLVRCPAQAQRNIQLQLETHNQYINSLLASRSSELARTISAASSARADGGGGPSAAGPPAARPASAHALRAPQPQGYHQLQQHQQHRHVGAPASVLQHPARGSGSQMWHGQEPSQGMQSPKLGEPAATQRVQ